MELERRWSHVWRRGWVDIVWFDGLAARRVRRVDALLHYAACDRATLSLQEKCEPECQP